MTRILRTASGLLAFRNSKLQVIPSGAVADDCICCGNGCPDRLCGGNKVLSYTYSVTLTDQLTFWGNGLSGGVIVKHYKAVTTGWSAFTGSYVLNQESEFCEFIMTSVEATISYDVFAYTPQSDCPDFSGTFENSGTFVAKSTALDPNPNVSQDFFINFAGTRATSINTTDDNDIHPNVDFSSDSPGDYCGPVGLTAVTGHHPGSGTECPLVTMTGTAQANT